MCGICGILWTSAENTVEQPTLDAMTDALSHRGPDDRGTLILRPGEGKNRSEAGIAFGHRRLSIIDLTDAGRQPLANEDETVWVTFNGEIYNFPELRAELLAKGHLFKTATDTEVIVHLYEEWGCDFPKKLSGMFAIGLWDCRKERLILARDRVGKKPLFYRRESNRILFASELKSLLTAPNIPREIDPIALDQYFTYQYVPHPRTIWRGISKLPPGHFAVWTPKNDWSVTRYWECDFNAEEQNLSEGEWSALLREKLEKAVKARLRSDVPLGAFLSGGIDSSIIVGLMTKFSPNKVRTFSIGFAQKEYDETPFARRTAERLGTDHTELVVTPDAEAIFPQIVRQYDEPYSDSSAIPTWYLCEMTRREVTVALSGDGGDELFAGYERYKAVAWAGALDFLPLALRRFLAGPVRTLIPASISQRSRLRRGKRFLEAVGMEPMERYLQWIAIFNSARLDALFSPAFKNRRNDFAAEEGISYDRLDFLREAQKFSDRRDFVTTISLTDILTYLPCDILTKVDIASMRHALEVRSPLLDSEVVELAVKMPISFKRGGGKGKKILRETFREFLPPELENRPKTGFGVPLDHWFRGPLKKTIQEALLDPKAPAAEYFNPEYVRRLLDEHLAGKFDHAYRLWSLLVFYQWSGSQWTREK